MTTTIASRPWVAERTAEINAASDAISALNVGDGVSVSVWTDIDAYTIVSKTASTITLRCDNAELLNRDELRFDVGGFAAHVTGEQRYAYTPNPDGHTVKITLRRWTDEEGNERRKWKRAGTRTFEQGGNAYAGRSKHHDYNF